MMRVQIWRTDWVPVLADAPQPGPRVKIWGRGSGPRLADDVQFNVSVALDILKYDSRIFLDNYRTSAKHKQMQPGLCAEETTGTNGSPGTNTVSGRENRFPKEEPGLERTRKEHWLCRGWWMKGMRLLPSLKGGALEVAFYIRVNRGFAHLPSWLESHSVSLLVS